MKLKFLQEGGAMPAGAAAQQQAQDPMEQIVAMAAQALQNNDPNLAMQVCDAIVQIAQGAAPAGAEGGAPAEGMPAEGEPVYRRGGKLVRRISK